MNVNLLPYAVFWAVLAFIVLSLLLYRRAISSHEDDSIHLEGTAPSEQVSLAHRLATVDRWGKMLTVVVTVYAIALAGIYFYQVWNSVPTY